MTLIQYYQDPNKPVHPYEVSEGDSGIDLKAAIEKDIVIEVGDHKLIPTNLYLEILSGYEGQVRSRSGLALKHGIMVLNSPGTIDANYRGEVGIILKNFGRESFTVKNGDRIAQLVIQEVPNVILKKVKSKEELSKTIRNEKGFGSSGK